MFARDAAAPTDHSLRPRADKPLACCVLGHVTWQDVDVEMVVADVAENHMLKFCGCKVTAVKAYNLRQDVVGHGEVGAELGEVGQSALTLGDHGVDLFRNRMPEEFELIERRRICGEPCVARIAVTGEEDVAGQRGRRRCVGGQRPFQIEGDVPSRL